MTDLDAILRRSDPLRGTHVIEIADELLLKMAQAANPGYRVEVTWSEPDEDGIYVAILHTHSWEDER